jgi:aldose 1-epimerase
MRSFTQANFQPETLATALEGHTTRIAVLPRLGANLISFQVDGREFIHWDPDRLLAAEPHMTGCFHMFPSPCRLGQSRYTFEGQEIIQRKRGDTIHIHGLIRDEEFAIQKSDRELIATLDFDDRHPVYEGFPFPGRVAIRYRLIPRGLEVTFSYQNRGQANAPVGYGIHPFWQIPADRADALVKVPCEYRLELDDYVSQLPTGKLIPVAGTKYDLRDYRSLADLFIDDVFYPRPPEAEAAVAFPREGIRVKIEAGPNMKHMICYSPEGRPFVCLENLTCAPDAQNLQPRGFSDMAGLIVVAPGQKMEARVRYTLVGS